MDLVEEKRIPATLVLAILVLYTALGGVLMSKLEPWSFFTAFYYSFITMTTVRFVFQYFPVLFEEQISDIYFYDQRSRIPIPNQVTLSNCL